MIGPLRESRALIGSWGRQGEVGSALRCPLRCGARGNKCAGVAYGRCLRASLGKRYPAATTLASASKQGSGPEASLGSPGAPTYAST